MTDLFNSCTRPSGLHHRHHHCHYQDLPNKFNMNVLNASAHRAVRGRGRRGCGRERWSETLVAAMYPYISRDIPGPRPGARGLGRERIPGPGPGPPGPGPAPGLSHQYQYLATPGGRGGAFSKSGFRLFKIKFAPRGFGTFTWRIGREIPPRAAPPRGRENLIRPIPSQKIVCFGIV